jgi:hypothetical protein
MRAAMWICCAVMLAPVGFVMLGGAGLEGLSLGLLAPVALCLGAHGVMHRFMGRSCHGQGRRPAAAPVEAPVAAEAPRPVAGAGAS